MNLALTARIGRYAAASALSPHLLNQSAAEEYRNAIQRGDHATLPEIIIELYFTNSDETASLRGRNNSLLEDCPGVRLWIHFDQDYADEYAEFLTEPAKARAIPIEYYKVEWLAFSGTSITQRSLKVSSSLVDASKIRLQSGTDYFLQRIIRESLTNAERVRLARAYADLKGDFASSDGVAAINTALDARRADITTKTLSLSIDASPSAAWESALIPHLDDLPFEHSGGGEQSTLKVLLALTRRVEGAHIILIEEPENHLSFPRLNKLVKKISELCEGKQVVITTHSSFVLNRLGLGQLLLLRGGSASRFADIPPETTRFFQKLPGYDTLRLVLADSAVLVEGPSDELIVQRAHLDKHGCLAIEKGVDVISVRGLSFKRFLDIAAATGTAVRVVTDNDGDPDAVKNKYKPYATKQNIRICYSSDPTLPTLEPQLVAVNNLQDLNTVLDSSFTSLSELQAHISKPENKTEAALRVFTSSTTLVMPSYITEAVS